MCTAISYKTQDHYFGRNLDLERGYGENVVITPRRYPLHFRRLPDVAEHYAMIGMAAVSGGYPLYFEATNEKGLSVAGLNFPQNAFYPSDDSLNGVAPFELIPYLLGTCASTREAQCALEGLNVLHIDFSKALPVSPLHWIISDDARSLTLECTRAGMQVYDNPFGVLTNNPTFDYHRTNVENYMNLHEGELSNTLCKDVNLSNYSLGMGALGLPGDFSSASRFVRAVYVKEKSVCDGGEKESVNQFFHILSSVAMPRGCVLARNGQYEYTRYSSCCNTKSGVYYYRTYGNSVIRRVDMNEYDLFSKKLISVSFED